MRPKRVAASVTLTVILASVIGVAPAGSQQPERYQAIEQGFRPVLLADTPTMAVLLDPADRSAGRLAPDGRLLEPARDGAARARPKIVQPGAAAAAVPIPTLRPRPTAPPSSPAPSSHAPPTVSWQHDPDVSWYGPGFYGHRTACGRTLTTTLVGVAHRTLPCGTLVTFRNPVNGRRVTVAVVDRGPYVAGRQWDLTGGLCLALDHCYTGAIDWHLGP
jgi:Lytic transglycolase